MVFTSVVYSFLWFPTPLILLLFPSQYLSFNTLVVVLPEFNYSSTVMVITEAIENATEATITRVKIFLQRYIYIVMIIEHSFLKYRLMFIAPLETKT